MTMPSRLTLVTALLATSAITAHATPADAGFDSAPPLGDSDAVEPEVTPPSAVTAMPAPIVTTVKPRKDPLATTERWGGGVRATGLSGIGALPGVNYGAELAAFLRHDELFAELGFGWWKPEKTYVLTESPEHVELKLDVWTLRAGWASMKMPIRIWALAEVGEMASARGMPGVVTRMMTGDVPQERRWRALGGGLGVAWPMSDNARLFGMTEIAVPVSRHEVMLDLVGGYQPDPLAARASAGLEVGWR